MADRQVWENMLIRVLSPWESAPAAGIRGACEINWNFSRLSMMMQCLAKKVWIHCCKPLKDYSIKSLAAWLGASKLSLIPTTPMALHAFLRNADNFSLSTHRFRWPSTSSQEDKEMNVGFRRWSWSTICNTVLDVINVYLSCLISSHWGSLFNDVNIVYNSLLFCLYLLPCAFMCSFPSILRSVSALFCLGNAYQPAKCSWNIRYLVLHLSSHALGAWSLHFL